MRASLFLIVIMLAGCASAPNGLRESTVSETIVRPSKLWDAAFCVTSGFDERIKTLNTLRINETSGWAEMIGKDHDHSELIDSGLRSGALYVVDFKVLASGTEVTYHVRSDGGRMPQFKLDQRIH